MEIKLEENIKNNKNKNYKHTNSTLKVKMSKGKVEFMKSGVTSFVYPVKEI